MLNYTLQIGQREKLKVIRGPGHFLDSTDRQQWAWKTCLHLSYNCNQKNMVIDIDIDIDIDTNKREFNLLSAD